jgi:hypothetical protein
MKRRIGMELGRITHPLRLAKRSDQAGSGKARVINAISDIDGDKRMRTSKPTALLRSRRAMGAQSPASGARVRPGRRSRRPGADSSPSTGSRSTCYCKR